METILSAPTQPKTSATTNWNQVTALVALNAAVVISWIAYHNYQPKVLEIFHFQELALFLVIAQCIILVFIPPIAGIIGDKMIQNGNRFIVFTVGVSVTAMTFMSVAFTVGTASSINLTAALPVMIVIWLISMNIFHSPANSMLELFTPAKGLPIAMALMTMTTELLYALEPVVVWFVDLIGPVFTFLLGGVLLVVTGFFFRKSTKDVNLQRDNGNSAASQSNLPLVIIVGSIFGMATAILMNVFPTLLATKLEDYSHTTLGGSHFVSFILGIAALLALPISKIVNYIGLRTSLVIGLTGTFIFILLAMVTENDISTLVSCIFLSIFYSLSSVAAFPFILRNLSPKNVTFGAGIFFGSIELADGLMNIFDKL